MTINPSLNTDKIIESIHIGAIQIDIIESLKDGKSAKIAIVAGHDILPSTTYLAQSFGDAAQRYELLPVAMLGVNQRNYRIKLPDDSFIELHIDDKLTPPSALRLLGNGFKRKNSKKTAKNVRAIATIEFVNKAHRAERAGDFPTSYRVELLDNKPLRVVERWHQGNQYVPNKNGVIERLTRPDGKPLHSETLFYGEKAEFRVRRTIIKRLGFKIAREVWILNEQPAHLHHSATLWPNLKPYDLEQNKDRKTWQLARRYSPSNSAFARFIVKRFLTGRDADLPLARKWPVLNDDNVPVRAEGSKGRKGKQITTMVHPPLFTGAKPTGPT